MSETELDTWTLWMSKAQQGDKAAYNKLLSEIYPYIKNFLYSAINDKDALEDLVQEVIVSMHNSRHTFDGERAFKPWLNSIINYRKIDYFRKIYKDKSQGVEDLDYTAFANDFVTNPGNAGEYKDIEAALGHLSNDQRKVFELMKIQGFTAKEAANETGMSESAVKVSVHRSMKKIQDLLR